MNEYQIGLLGIVALLALLLLRIPVAFAMFIVGFFGIAILSGMNAAIQSARVRGVYTGASPELVVIPLFILMGNIASATGLSRQLYQCRLRAGGQACAGGLASATIVGCGGFAALSGSSVASALTMGKVALKEMDAFNYDARLSTGAVAAGGTLGILIPPSTGFVVYAILTEQSIGRLFLAGILPGLLLLGLFIGAISLVCWRNPALGPAGPRAGMSQRARAVLGAVPVVGIVLLTIGGIYTGLFSPVDGICRRRRCCDPLRCHHPFPVARGALERCSRCRSDHGDGAVNPDRGAYDQPFHGAQRYSDVIGSFVLGFGLPLIGVLLLMPWFIWCWDVFLKGLR